MCGPVDVPLTEDLGDGVDRELEAARRRWEREKVRRVDLGARVAVEYHGLEARKPSAARVPSAVPSSPRFPPIPLLSAA
jgi:hypothetical protein